MSAGRPEPSAALDRAVDDQCLAVLAALDDLDQDLPGAVHDARVALRRLRSTLVVFRPLLEPGTVHLERELRWFATELGAARDVQVVRERIGADGDVPAVALLLEEMDREAARSWQRAEQALAGPRLAELRVQLHRTRLGTVARDVAEAPSATGELGAAIADVLVRARTTVAAVADDEDLHRLRRRIKRIRFATGTWQEGIGEGSGAGRLVRRLADLQELLGDHQDAVIAAVQLERLAARLPAVGPLARDLALQQRAAAAAVRDRLPPGIERLLAAARRLERRTPDVHLNSP